MPKLKTAAVLWFLVLVCYVFPKIAPADQFEISPYIALRGEYNDNIFFSDDEIDDFAVLIPVHAVCVPPVCCRSVLLRGPG